jgi:hypothetical protein
MLSGRPTELLDEEKHGGEIVATGDVVHMSDPPQQLVPFGRIASDRKALPRMPCAGSGEDRGAAAEAAVEHLDRAPSCPEMTASDLL